MGSGALPGKKLLLRIIKNDKIYRAPQELEVEKNTPLTSFQNPRSSISRKSSKFCKSLNNKPTHTTGMLSSRDPKE